MRVLLALLVALGAGSLAFLTLGNFQWSDLLRLLSEVLDSYRVAGYGIYLLTFFVAAMLGIVPLSLIAMLGGAVYGVALGFMLSGVAALASSVAAFLLSRHAFRAPIHRWLSNHLVLVRLDEEIARRGWRVVLLLRLSPIVPFSLGSYAFGLTTVRLHAYVLGTLGALPALFAFVYSGALSGLAVATLLGAKATPGALEAVLFVGGLLFTVAALVYFARVARNALRSDLLRSGPTDSI